MDRYKRFSLENAEIRVLEEESISFKTRNLKLENIERSESTQIVINAFKDNKQATITTNNIDYENPNDVLEKLSGMIEVLPEDRFSGLPDKQDYAQEIQDLKIFDSKNFADDYLISQAKEAEEEMLTNKKVTNTEGASRSLSRKNYKIFSSKGFVGEYKKTLHSISAVAIAGRDTGMQRDYEYSLATHEEDLLKPSIVGQKAAERAVSRLNSKKIKSCKVDVIFEPRVAKSILSSFSSCINGNLIARGTSFLANKKDKQVLKKGTNISNNPHLIKGIGSSPFDKNGVRNNKIDIVKDGKLLNYFLDTRSSKQLQFKQNGNSNPANFTLNRGTQELKDIINNIKNGILVTEMLGMSFNSVNGDYSRGASGFKIENGRITFPVSEVTIAGNMNDMLLNLTPADNLSFDDNINTPSILIENMTLAGV